MSPDSKMISFYGSTRYVKMYPGLYMSGFVIEDSKIHNHNKCYNSSVLFLTLKKTEKLEGNFLNIELTIYTSVQKFGVGYNC